MNATNIQVKSWQNGNTYVDWTSSSDWYAGYHGSGDVRVGCVKFTLAYKASTVSIPLKTYNWEYTGESNPLYYAVSGGAADPAYINRSTAGGIGSIYWDAAFETKTVTLTDVSAGTNYLYLWGTPAGGQSDARFYAVSGITYEPIMASTIASISQSVYTESALSLTVNRAGNYWHRAVFRVDGAEMATSDVFEASLSYTVPRSWFADFPTVDSLTVNVSVQTYTDSACTATLGEPVSGSFTLLADSGMKPALTDGFAAAAPYNTGAAASLGCFVQGYSRAQVSFDANGVDLTDTWGASIAGYEISAGGQTVSASPYLTPVLTGATDILCTVTDSRGRSASTTLTVTPESYSTPSITGLRVFRCDEDGAENEDENYISATATAVISSLAGENSAALSLQYRPKGGSWSQAKTMESGKALVAGGTISPDLSYEVRVSLSDALNSCTAVSVLPTRKWALKFRPSGMGAAFGKAPETDETLELPEGWNITIGGKNLFDLIYPVGCYYFSDDPTDPGTLFGGTWERIKDVFLLAAGDTYAAGASGGAAEASITKNNLPDMQLSFYMTPNSHSATWISGVQRFFYDVNTKTEANTYTYLLNYDGGEQPLSTMPPYTAAYCWKRTAYTKTY